MHLVHAGLALDFFKSTAGEALRVSQSLHGDYGICRVHKILKKVGHNLIVRLCSYEGGVYLATVHVVGEASCAPITAKKTVTN